MRAVPINSGLSGITGLRGYAVVIVIFYHLDLLRLGNGYIGVDLFFVISGFVITRKIYFENLDKSFGLKNFWIGRIKRLVPSLALVILITTFFSLALINGNDLKTLADSMTALLLINSNTYFFSNLNYFTQTDLFPILHTWSLGVEDQFYLLFPLVFLFFTRKSISDSKKIAYFILFASLSLIFSISCRQIFSSFIFYLLPGRLWELLLGVIAFLLVKYINLPKYLRYLSYFLFISIAFGVIYFPVTAIYPSKLSLWVCLLTALLLMTLEKGQRNYLLSNPIAILLGSSSYAIYLWHYPIICIVNWKYPNYQGYLSEILLVLMSILLGLLTTHYLENPVRYSENTKVTRQIYFTSTSIFLICIISLNIVANSQMKQKTTMQEVANFSNFDYSKMMRKSTCFVEANEEFYEFPGSCYPKNTKGQSYFIMGDSHAASLSYGLRHEGLNLGQFTYSGCPPFTGVNQLGALYRPYCKDVNEAAFTAISTLKPTGVILLANWILYPWFDEATLLKDSVLRIHKLSPKTKVIVIGGLPQWKPDLPTLLVRQQTFPNLNAMLLNRQYAELAIKDNQLSLIAEANDAKFISVQKHLCRNSKCYVYSKTPSGALQPISWDYGHLGPAGSIKIADYLIKDLTH